MQVGTSTKVDTTQKGIYIEHNLIQQVTQYQANGSKSKSMQVTRSNPKCTKQTRPKSIQQQAKSVHP